LIIVFDHLDGRQFVLVNPAYEFPRSLFFVGDFLDFEIKEGLLGGFDSFLKGLPIFKHS